MIGGSRPFFSVCFSHTDQYRRFTNKRNLRQVFVSAAVGDLIVDAVAPITDIVIVCDAPTAVIAR